MTCYAISVDIESPKFTPLTNSTTKSTFLQVTCSLDFDIVLHQMIWTDVKDINLHIWCDTCFLRFIRSVITKPAAFCKISQNNLVNTQC